MWVPEYRILNPKPSVCIVLTNPRWGQSRPRRIKDVALFQCRSCSKKGCALRKVQHPIERCHQERLAAVTRPTSNGPYIPARRLPMQYASCLLISFVSSAGHSICLWYLSSAPKQGFTPPWEAFLLHICIIVYIKSTESITHHTMHSANHGNVNCNGNGHGVLVIQKPTKPNPPPGNLRPEQMGPTSNYNPRRSSMNL